MMTATEVDLGSIKPRQPALGFEADLPAAWYRGNPAIQRLCNVISISFPAGEQFFIDSVRHYQGEVHDPALKQAVAGFIGQEALHRRQHERCNALLLAHDPGLARFAPLPGKVLQLTRRLPARTRLAVTCALEHMTASFAHNLLATDGFRNNAHPTFGRLWIWHAIEESEHKAVCFDVYQRVAGGVTGYLERCVAMLLVSVVFLAVVSAGFWMSTPSAPRRPAGPSAASPPTPRLGAGLRRMLFGRGELIPDLVGPWCRYFLPGFHPWHIDNSALIARWRVALEGEDLQTPRGSDAKV